MSLRTTVAAGLLLAALVPPARAQTPLEWRFKDGEKFYVEAVTDTKQTITMGDRATTSASTFTTVSRFVIKKAADGYGVEQTIEGVKVSSSRTDDPTLGVRSRYANQLKGTTFKFTLSPNGQVTSKTIDGYDDLIKKLSGGSEAIEKEVRARLPENAFREELNAIFGFLPHKAVSSGDGWEWRETLSMPWGTLKGKASYTYRGRKAKEGEEITVNHEWTLELAKDAPGVKVTKGDLKVDKAEGTIHCDPAAGRLIGNTQTTHAAGRLTMLDSSMKEVAFDIDRTTTRTLRRVDENPLK
jgi:hypothetical protein